MSLLSIIITISHDQKHPDSLKQLDQLITGLSSSRDTEIILYDSSEQALARHDRPCRDLTGCYYHHDSGKHHGQPGALINQAVSKATGKYILLLPPDTLLAPSLIAALPKHLSLLGKEGAHAFSLYPCLYMAPAYYDQTVEALPEKFNGISQDFFQGVTGKGTCLSVASGALLLRRHWFIAIGGCQARYERHEYTRIDLMHRLAAYWPVCQKTEDYAVDIQSDTPAGELGFRRYFSLYALPQLFKGQFLVCRQREDTSPAARQQDVASFAQVLSKGAAGCRSINPGSIKASSELGRRMLAPPFSSSIPPLSQKGFIQALAVRHGLNEDDYPGLFIPQHDGKIGEIATKKGLASLIKRLYRLPSRWLKRAETT